MSHLLAIHPEDPQPRLIAQAAQLLRAGGVIVYPTDVAYALGCCVDQKAAIERLLRIRELDDKHLLTVACQDIAQIAHLAIIDNTTFRLLRRCLPGPYTFILKAQNHAPRGLLRAKRKTIGIRVPDAPILHALLQYLGTPLLTTTLRLPGDDEPLTEPYEMLERLSKRVDAIIDGGTGSLDVTSVIDLSGDIPQILRRSQGDLSYFE